MQIDFGRSVCGDYDAASRREWLVTNGLGGYAAGTLAGVHTRRYHGLLVAALQPPSGRTLLLSRLEEVLGYRGRNYRLSTNRWASGVIEPQGYRHLERFRLEGTTPVWSFACAEVRLEKRVWMQLGENTTYIRYDYQRGSEPVALTLKALVNYRGHHGSTHAGGWRMDLEPVEHGLRVTAYEGAMPFYLLAPGAAYSPAHIWNKDYFLALEAYRGLPATDDLLEVGTFSATLEPGEQFTLVASLLPAPKLDGRNAYAVRQAHERHVIAAGAAITPRTARAPRWVPRLLLAADQFIVRRPLPGVEKGRTVIAGYPWFGDWGRDTMISLPGLTLATGRPELASEILLTFASYVDQGMLPNHFPGPGEAPVYNTVDAALWYFEAIHAYHQTTGDRDLVHQLYPTLEAIIAWHRKGTRYQIHLDPDDGLLYAGEPSVQLTWMDARVGDWVVTPRTGKVVEVNALWYNALQVMASFARLLGKDPAFYERLADTARDGFVRFWNAEQGYCYDVLDGPEGPDPTLRPNQLLAVSLPHSPLEDWQQKAVVDVCAHQLAISHGMRSLTPHDLAYVGRYGGDQARRDAAYHQGTVWGWLMGPFISAHLRVYDDPAAARSYLEPLLDNLLDHGLGNLSEIFDGDPPHAPRGCIAQAWTVAEVLRVWRLLQSRLHQS